MKDFVSVPLVYMRGGTSKGAYLRLEDLPQDPQLRDQVILDIYGSPDIRQINGIGGADPLTSKVALVEKSERADADVNYTFGYVGIRDAVVDYEGNCGNMSAGVGPFAIYTGLVTPVEPVTIVRIYNTNTRKLIEAHVPVQDGEVVAQGDYAIDGVPGTGARIVLNFLHSGGAKTGKLLPTGNAVDEMVLGNGKRLRVSLVDAANPCAFVRAEDIGLAGTEMPQDIGAHPEWMETLEEIRVKAAVRMGLAATEAAVGPAVPKVAIVAAPQEYTALSGKKVRQEEVDLVARTKALDVIHKAYAVTGGICAATAALLEGTVVHEVVGAQAKANGVVRLGHPSGVLDFEIQLQRDGGVWQLVMAGVSRTAKMILAGQAFVSRDAFRKKV